MAVIIHKMDSAVEVEPGAEAAAAGAPSAPAELEPGAFRDKYAAIIREIVRDEIERRARNAD